MFEFIIKEIFPLLLSLIAIIISYIALHRTKMRDDKNAEEEEFEIKFGIEKELLNNKINILHAINIHLEESLMFFFDYESIIKDEDKFLIPSDIKISSKWWLENSNKVSKWSISNVHRYSKIYESISLLESKRNQQVNGKLAKEILNEIDNSTYIWQYKIIGNYLLNENKQ